MERFELVESRNKNMRKLLLILMLWGCTGPLEYSTFTNVYDLTLDSRLLVDNNGYSHLEYSGEKYFMFGFETQPLTRVFWSSPDSFSVVIQNQVITSPIVDFSSISDDDGKGSQGIFLSNDFVGDTLEIYGYISEFIADSLKIIIQ